jgi:hypothetical protein
VIYTRRIGRLQINVNENGAKMHDYGHGCEVGCVAGWNESCPMVNHMMSVEEMRDLRYLLDRAIAAADEYKSRMS